MMWSAASLFFKGEHRKNQVFAIFWGIIILILGQFPFSRLLGIFYPMVGYSGLIYIACVLWKGLKREQEQDPKLGNPESPSKLLLTEIALGNEDALGK